MCVRRSPVVATSKRSRSAVTNGSRAHQKGDERSAGARRFRDLVAAFSADLGADLSESDLAMVRTADLIVRLKLRRRSHPCCGLTIFPRFMPIATRAGFRSMLSR